MGEGSQNAPVNLLGFFLVVDGLDCLCWTNLQPAGAYYVQDTYIGAHSSVYVPPRPFYSPLTELVIYGQIISVLGNESTHLPSGRLQQHFEKCIY